MSLITEEMLPELKELLRSAKSVIAIDTETNITDRYQDRYCMGISGCIDGVTFYLPVGHVDTLGLGTQNIPVPSDLLSEVGAPVVFHNAKFDIHVLENAGIVIPENFKFYDTMLMCHLINENEFNFGLDAMSKKYVGRESLKEKETSNLIRQVGWENIPAKYMARYAEMDAKLTADLYLALKERFSYFEAYWETESKFLLVLQKMERKGVLVDLNKVKELRVQCHNRLEQIKTEIGFDPAKTSILHKKLFDLPPVGYGLKVLERTPTGKPKVGDKFLEVTNHPVVGLIREFRQINKQLTSYYNSYLNLCSGYGRIHASFRQHGTVTGRLSCADPNMQQIPRDSPVKSLFKPDPGFQLWEIDFKNIEMRLAAVYSNEKSLLDTFAQEGDVHQLTADLLKITRQHAKTVNFLIIYGGGAKALSQQINLSEKECKAILDRFKEAYPRLFATMRAATESAESNGSEIRMWSGRIRHFHFSNENHKAFNSIVQGGSFEIVKRSMLLLQEAGFDMRNQVHDSVWINVASEKEVRDAESIMSDWTEPEFGLKFSVESKRLS
jgi:DNA polymerase-1